MSTAAAVEGAVPAKAGKKKLIIIVVAVLLLLAAAGGGVLFWLKSKAHAERDADDGDGSSEQAASHAVAKRDPKAVPVFVPLDNFTVNLADREAERYAQIGISLELDDPRPARRIKLFMPAIRNNILMVLSHKRSSDLLEREGKEKLADEVLRETERALGLEPRRPARPARKTPTRAAPGACGALLQLHHPMKSARSGQLRAERQAAPKPARIPLGERRRSSCSRLLGNSPPKRQPACRPVGRSTYPSNEGLH